MEILAFLLNNFKLNDKIYKIKKKIKIYLNKTQILETFKKVVI